MGAFMLSADGLPENRPRVFLTTTAGCKAAGPGQQAGEILRPASAIGAGNQVGHWLARPRQPHRLAAPLDLRDETGKVARNFGDGGGLHTLWRKHDAPWISNQFLICTPAGWSELTGFASAPTAKRCVWLPTYMMPLAKTGVL